MPTTITLIRESSSELAQLPLTDCEGRPDPRSAIELALLARPRVLEERPSERELSEHAGDPRWVAAGVRRLHPGLLERLRALADRFPGHAIEIIAGFRPDAREGSRHLHGLAIDVRVRGASLDTVHAYLLRFDRTGVGLHRSAGFVHLDVRPESVHWIDDAAPGEPARAIVDETPRRGVVVRAAHPITADAEIDEAALDVEVLASEIARGLGELHLPPPP